jgi:diacylglycerol kinase (ATP)
MDNYRAERIKLIFNPISGRASASPTLLQDVIAALQALNFIPEVYLIQPGGDLKAVIEEALRHRIYLFVVCGGDGTIEAVSRLLISPRKTLGQAKRATLGLIPTGTQNNIALSLGIPAGVKEAVLLLRNGQRNKIDVGLAKSGDDEIPFLEVCSVGLFSALFSSADNLQKGDLTGIGDILSTLASFPLADIHLLLDEDQRIELKAHVALVANLPYFGLNYRVTPDSHFDESPASSWQDGVLDVLVFTEFSKLELVGNVLQTVEEEAGDHRIRRYRAKKLEIQTNPVMPVQADGTPLGNTPVKISVIRKAISVITGLPAQRQPRWGFLRNLNILRFFKK